ncbi:MAG: 23S rRNA (uridine(2479)-2'-O)-methyltransferase [Tenericutes bacterium ADurb.BinA155]|jgi:RNA methyltransferase, TrmH family|nr:MAG: 23S rRNA (uridine(2479)-2'-O)-methyltransferase [Tenericutes bacterium ADurb.BinA155]
MFKYKKEEDVSYTLGTTLSIELLKRKKEAASRLYISPKQLHDETYEKLLALAKDAGVPVIENNDRIFKDLSDKDNVMAIVEFKKYSVPLEPNANHVVLVNPSNMGNLGTIIRAMAGFSLLNLAIVKPACDIFDPKVIRASMGALFDIHFELFDSFSDYQKAYPVHHFYPFMLQATTPLKNVKKEEPFALIFGNEATGLDRSYLQLGTPLIIPHSDLIDSLNLDNAVSIGLYEFTK